MEVTLFRPRLATLAALVLGLVLAPSAARAAAEVHRLNLALSAVPTQVKAGDFNDVVTYYNNTVLSPLGFDPLDKVSFSWMFDAELRYFVTRSLSVNAGVGHLRAKTAKEYLPAIASSINIHADLITVPVHLGASYYLQPYNQGDFQARMFMGGGMVQYTHSRVIFEQTLSGADSASTANLGGSFKIQGTNDAPGYYLEGGVHMFFAARYSLMLSALYRSGEVQGIIEENTAEALVNPISGKPLMLDVSGLGLRLSANIGF
jgi:hypothetical protein